MLTGSINSIISVSEKYKVYHNFISNDGVSTDYLVDHSSIIYFMNDKGVFISHFNHETSALDIASFVSSSIRSFNSYS